MRTPDSKQGKFSLDNILQLCAALFIILGPIVISSFGRGVGLYGMFALMSFILCSRILSEGQLYITVNVKLLLIPAVYALICCFSAQNTYGNIKLIFLLFSAAEIMLLSADYFTLEQSKKIGGRLAYMVIFSGGLLSAANIVYWAFADKFSFSEPFCFGIVQKDLLGIFMFSALWCSIKTYAAEKKKHNFLLVICIPMVFALIMSQSPLTWFFGSAFAALYLWKGKKYIPCAFFGAVGTGFGIYCISDFLRTRNIALADAAFTIFKYPLGIGGGGFISMQKSLQSADYSVNSIGSGAELISALGVIGLLFIISFIGYQLYLIFKYRKWFNAFALLLCIYAFFAAMSFSEAGVLLLACVCVFGEWRLGKTKKVTVSPIVSIIISLIIGAASIYGCFLAVSDIFLENGRRHIISDPQAAASDLSTAASLNSFNAEGCYLAANSYRYLFEETGEKESFINAQYEISRAINREENNAVYYSEHALLLSDAEDFLASTAMWEKAISLAPMCESYKVSLSGDLCRLIESYEKGSLDAQHCYMRIMECGEAVKDMDNKKIINDYADKAQPYIRIDFYENKEEAEE